MDNNCFVELPNPNLIAISSSRNRSPSSQNPIAAVLLQPSFSIGVLFILLFTPCCNINLSRNLILNNTNNMIISKVCLFVFACLMLLSTAHPLLVKSGSTNFLSQGYAYVAMNQVVSLVATLFRSQLSKTLILTNIKWTASIRDQEKHRLTPIVEALSSSYLGPDFSQPREYAEISLKDIDQVAKTSFPLCMRHLFDKLKEDHHLKHGGRMQLGLFLKGVGLNLDDALAFWRAEFSKKIGLEKFEKEYSYNIRHNYGKEGKRTDYTPYSCQKVISSTPGAGDQHGCPYRQFSEENLRAALGRMGVNSRAMEDVMDKVRNRHYQLACTLTFEALHGVTCDAGINHPNQYFSDSQKILQPKGSNIGSSFEVRRSSESSHNIEGDQATPDD
ncbi:DNA primase, large subunit family [Trifolium repens]|nr:DNA primase, large subunit family [Trifolium repens]